MRRGRTRRCFTASKHNAPVTDTLRALAQLDIDATYAYNQAIDAIDHPQIRARLIEFRADHERHITDLSACLRQLGAEPPERSRDFKGFLIEGFTAIRSMTGTEGALKAMQGNEETTNKAYREALSAELPADVRALVQRNYEDEWRHLAYITAALAERTWDRAA